MTDENRALKVFLCHAHSDKDAVKVLYARLKREGVDAWLDKEKLLPGVDWELEIRKAVREADVVVVCLSKQFNQAGFRQKEVRIALDAAMEKPEGEIFIIPARLEECDTLDSLSRWHWVDLFEVDGYQMFMRALRVRAEKIGATLPQRSVPRPKIKDEQKAAREKAEKEAAEKARLEAEAERQRLAREKAKKDAAEKTAREKAEKDAAEKARLEAEEAEKRRLAKENAKREADEKARRDNAKREEVETKPSLKPEIQKPQDNSNAMLWIVGGILVIILVVWLSSLNGTPSVPVLTSTYTPSSQVSASSTLTRTPTPNIVSNDKVFNPHPDSSDYLDAYGVPMRLVPEGEFTMGSNNGESNEKPVHTVYLHAFYMDTYEVTNALYHVCVEAGKCTQPQDDTGHYDDPKYGNHPVIYVDWSQAQAYCEWRDGSLPTDAQWEKAAAWDEQNQTKYEYPWGDTFDGTKVNFCDKNCPSENADKTIDDGYADTAPVGSYVSGQSPYGIYDLAGNVYEWTVDWYSETYYQSSSYMNPLGPASGITRVLRGGSRLDPVSGVRTASRLWFVPEFTSNVIGFRCAHLP